MHEEKDVPRTLLAATLLSYLLIPIPNDKWTVFMFMIIIFDFLAIYDVWTFLYYVLLWVGPLIFVRFLFLKKPVKRPGLKYLFAAILSMYSCLLILRIPDGINFRLYGSVIEMIPEPVFYVLSLVLLYRLIRLKFWLRSSRPRSRGV